MEATILRTAIIVSFISFMGMVLLSRAPSSNPQLYASPVAFFFCVCANTNLYLAAIAVMMAAFPISMVKIILPCWSFTYLCYFATVIPAQPLTLCFILLASSLLLPFAATIYIILTNTRDKKKTQEKERERINATAASGSH